MNRNIRYAGIAVVWMAVVPLFAQSDMRGHWSGSIATPNGPLTFEIDLDRATAGWVGSVSVPAQGAEGMPLDAITFNGGKGSFHFKGGPGDPAFSGTLSADGKTMDGTFTQGGASLPLKLARTGEAKVELPKASAAVAPEFAGTWEGTLALGSGLRIQITITNGKAGAEGTFVSVDQGGAQIPVSAITQAGTKLTLDIKAISGGYQGEINMPGNELNGTFTQRGYDLPLQLKKKAQ